MNDPYLLALVAIVGGLAGSLITALVSYKLNEQSKERDRQGAERSRQLDLYKAVYPEKVRAFGILTDTLVPVYTAMSSVLTERRSQVTVEQVDVYDEQLDKLVTQARSYEMLLGSEIADAAVVFRAMWHDRCYKACSTAKALGVSDDMALSHRKLTESLRRSVHLDTFDPLFR